MKTTQTSLSAIAEASVAAPQTAELAIAEPTVEINLPAEEDSTAEVAKAVASRPVQFNLSDEAYQKLSQLKELLGASSKTEVFRLGLGVLGWVVEELAQDHKIFVKRPSGETVELAFPYLNTKKKAQGRKGAA